MLTGIEKRQSALLLAVAVTAVYLIFLLKANTVRWLTQEDGILETLGAVMCFVACSGFGWAYSRSSRPSGLAQPGTRVRKNTFYLLLALFFLLAFFEEISWGQRIFHLETPAAIRSLNRQGETNLHNLEWFHGRDESGNRKPFLQLLINADRMFSMFWFVYCVCIPLLVRFNQRARNLAQRIRLPIVPVEYAFLFLLSYGTSRGVVAVRPMYHHAIVEAKETIFEALFACIALGQAYGLSVRWSVRRTKD